MLKKILCLAAIIAGMVSSGIAEVAVDLTFSPVDGDDFLPARPLDVSTTNEATYAWSDTVPLFDGVATNGQTIYGAFTVTGSNCVAGADLQIQDPGGSGNDFVYFYGQNSTTTEVNSFVAFVLWDSADFLQPGLDSFDTRVDSALTLGVHSFIQSDGLRFVIRADGEMYVSSLEYTGSAVLRGTDYESLGLGWATFSTNDWSLFDSSEPDLGMGVTNFTPKIFTNNITGVGIIANGFRPAPASTVLRINGFKAELVTEPQEPVVEVDVAVVVDLDQGSFGGEGPDRLPDVDNSATTQSEITYNFSATSPLFTEPGLNAVPIYGGYSTVGSGMVSTNSYLTLNADGYIETRGIKPAGLTGTILAYEILLWDSADFLNPNYNIFGDTFDSQIAIDVKAITNPEGVNAIIRDGDTYYLSEGVIKGSGILVVSGLDAKWAPIDPADFKLYNPDDTTTFGLTTNAFEAHIFTDVTGAGLIAKVGRGGGNPAVIEINDIVVSLQANNDITPYEIWVAQWLPADVSDPTGDNDGDLLKNLGEYALNANPTNAADKGMIESQLDGSTFKYIYTRRADDTGLTYRLMDAPDLGFGVSVGTDTYDDQSLGPVVGDFQSVTNSYSTTESTKFIKLEIEQQ